MKIKICIEEGCKDVQRTKDYCRLHYMKNWKKIKESQQKKAADRLNKYVEGICNKFPDRFMEVIRREIKTGKTEAQVPFDDAISGGDLTDDLFEDLGIKDEDSLDKLLSNIKLDKNF